MRIIPSLLSATFLSLVIITGCTSSASKTPPESTIRVSEATAAAPESTTPAPGNTAIAPESTADASDSTASPNENTDAAEDNEAVQAAERYIHAEYQIKASEDILSEESVRKRNEEMKPFLTDYFYQKAVDNRYTLLPLQVAHKQNLSLIPANLQFNLEEHKKDTVELKYTLDLLLLDQQGKEMKRIPLEGILTLFNVNGQWLVQGDRFDAPALEKLIV
ncbi:hypothetical protein ACFSF2_19440 [Paenibacillus rhizophilus]|uniref:hypothetical protein n=1 Tax=Paenibacillus rhizophilus TaxID=1850366 RepID=UPI000F5BDFF5